MINVGILGGAGYTGGELLRVLKGHPDVEIDFIHSESQNGKPVAEVHTDLFTTDLRFTDQISTNVSLLFLCMGHGRSREFLQQHAFDPKAKIIDLSHDFRLAGSHQFVYGLPELQREKIRQADRIANPGCFATCIQLALLPLAAGQQIRKEIHVSAVTGSTGAGQKPTATSHFSWRSHNISVYKAFEHQHLAEIRQSISQLQTDYDQPLYFVPMRGNFTRGILASVYTPCAWSETEAIDHYTEYYRDHPFVKIVHQNPDVKQVVNTNYNLLYIRKYDGILHVISVIDNLTKGASGQAVQNMNLMFALPEETNLQLKSSAF